MASDVFLFLPSIFTEKNIRCVTLDNQAQEWKQKCLNDFKMGTDVDVLHASKVETVSTFICRIIEL